MDFAALEAAYSAIDGDDDIKVAIGVARRALVRAAYMPAGREQRRTLSEATSRLCEALEENLFDDPNFFLNCSTSHVTSRNAPETRASSSSKRARMRKVIIESDPDEEDVSTSDAESVVTEQTPARRSTRLAENVLKEAEPPSSPKEAPVADELTATPMPGANGVKYESSSSSDSDVEPELALPVVRPKPQVPPLPLVSDRASKTPAISAEDEDTEEELERSRRAHAPRPRPVLDLDSSEDNANGVEAYTRIGQETVIASPLRRSDAQQAVPIFPNTVQMGPIAPPNFHSQTVPRTNQRSDDISVEAEISAARASLTMAQEQQNNWIHSLNMEQERRMQAARLFAQQHNVIHGQRPTTTPYSHPNPVQGIQRSRQALANVARPPAVVVQNALISQAVQNEIQQPPQAPIATNPNPFASRAPINASFQPPSVPSQQYTQPGGPGNRRFRSTADGNALQLEIIRENQELEKQNEKLAELFAQQEFVSQLQARPAPGSQQAQLNEQRRQLQLREAALQQQFLDEQKRHQKYLQEQLRLERIRLLREAQEKKKLDLQLKELENQQKLIQERKKRILQQQIELQERHLREQQLQQQIIREQQRSRELIRQQQAHHRPELQSQRQIQVQHHQQMLRQQQVQQQLRNQQQFAQHRIAQQQNVLQKRIPQELQQDLRAYEQLAQEQEILQQRCQQPRLSQSYQQVPAQLEHQVVRQQNVQNGQFLGQKQSLEKLQKDNVTVPAPRAALGQGNLSSDPSSIANRVASFSSALFSLNGMHDNGKQPRNLSTPSAAPGVPSLLSFPNSSTPVVKQNQINRIESSAVNPSETPALHVSSATVEGKNGALGGPAPITQNGQYVSNSSAVQTMFEGIPSSQKRGRGHHRESRTPQAAVASANEVDSSVADRIEITTPPRLRFSKRALLEWDIEHLKGKQVKKEVSEPKRKKYESGESFFA